MIDYGNKIGDMAVGSTVKIKVDGMRRIFWSCSREARVLGDNDFDGTWVLTTNIIKQMRFHHNSNIMRFFR